MIRPVHTALFGVIGNPVRHSLSPAMMNALFRHLEIPAQYMALEVDEPAEDLTALARVGFSGLSVTLPHKEAAFRLAISIDSTAKAIGAVNTLRRSGLSWEGRNTDCIGAVTALQQATSLAGKSALVIGAGGASRAIIYGLKQAGAVVTVANRTESHGAALAGEFGCTFVPLGSLEAPCRWEVVVQCTPAGLAGKDSGPIVPPSFFQPGMVVMDIVYNPLWTPFACAAREAGAVVVPGLDMLLYQGVAQLEWWLSRPIPPDAIAVMQAALTGAIAHDQTH